jgi:DNA-binding GntR family transcriptional regulator
MKWSEHWGGVPLVRFAKTNSVRLQSNDAYRVREVLEGLAARLCCRKASQDDVELLRDLAQQIHAQSRKKSRAERSELEYQFPSDSHVSTFSGQQTRLLATIRREASFFARDIRDADP